MTTTTTFKWSIQDVEDLLKGTKHLIGSIKHSSFDNNELLLSKPYFIHNLLLEAIVEQPDDDHQSSTADDASKIWKEIIGNLRWLLNQSLMYNYDSNDDNEANLYFSKNLQHLSDGGGKKDIASNTLGEMVKWFPELSLEQIRKNVNFATFLVENVTPGDANRDVDLSADNRVSTWMSFNHHPQSGKQKFLLKTIDPQTKTAMLKRIVPPMNIHPRYGLKFEQKEENVYKADDIKNIFFRSRGTSTVLTFTFLVGRLLRNTNDDDEEMVPVDAHSSINDGDDEEEVEEEQFILNDRHWSEMRKPVEKFRGVSIVNRRGGGGGDGNSAAGLFDLYLHGAVSEETGGKENRLLMARNLEKSQFYTLQVKWGAEIVQVDKSVRILPSFYAIHHNDKCSIKQSFKNTLISDEIRPAFYLGGFVSRTRVVSSVLQQQQQRIDLPRIIRRKSEFKYVKSKCFTGLVCNLEILKTRTKNVPPELLDFIVKRQSVRNRRPRPPPSAGDAAAAADDDDDGVRVEQFIKKDVWMGSA